MTLRISIHALVLAKIADLIKRAVEEQEKRKKDLEDIEDALREASKENKVRQG